MGAIHEKRLAENEAVFRSVNERIRDAVDRFGIDEHVYEFLCECADPECAERIALSISDYEAIRADGRRFVLAPGHDRSEIELVVAADGDHVVVEKVGVAGETAETLDPRAA